MPPVSRVFFVRAPLSDLCALCGKFLAGPTDSMIRPYRGKRPEIAASAYIDPAAVIIGDVVIGPDSSVWPCTVIRGDVTTSASAPAPTSKTARSST